METVRVKDLDFVFISFKEPNKEYNYADLLNKVPWAKRVDGVVGFDNAHKAAAEVAETDFFISVDGDNIIDPKFILQALDFKKTNPKAVHRWRARNSVNGLIYGNGGVVGWPKETCLGMKTHENADTKENQIDFCWGVPHENLHNVYSETVINTSPNQAFTAGYREGVKMSLDQGSSINPAEFMSKMYRPNLKCLTTWMSVGADVENGKYAMLGARIGCWQTVIQKFEPEVVRDLDDINDRFDELDGEVDELIELYGNSLRQRLGITIADYDDEQSSFFKFCQPQWINKGVQDREQKYL
jgi:hypothetical protein